MNPGTAPTIAESDRLRFKVKQSPLTAALIILFIVVWVATWFDMDHVIFLTFAKVNERIRAGEVWRLFTASFLHAGIMHLWFNSMALASVGPVIERVYGRAQYLTAFLLGGAVGMLASVVLTPGPSVGASAGVFALLGVLLAFTVRTRGELPSRARRFLALHVGFVVALNVILGLLASFIDNAAHIGGVVGGFAVGLVLRPRMSLFVAKPPPVPATARIPAQQQAPSALRHRAGRICLGWAGQQWKMAALLLGMAGFAIASFLAVGYLGWACLAATVGFGIALSARCPGCKVAVFWWCVSKLPANKALQTAFECESCPVCRYPDASMNAEAAPGAAEPLARGQ